MTDKALEQTIISFSPSEPELVYRSRGPPLTSLLNGSILARSRTISTEMQRGNVQYEIVNNLSTISLEALNQERISGFVSPCGFNHTEIEVIGVGGQCDPKPTVSQLDKTERGQEGINVSPLQQCLKDILYGEYPHCRNQGVLSEGQSYVTPLNKEIIYSDQINETSETIPLSPFRLKRLARYRPRCFETDRLAEIRVDDKMPSKPFIYARNNRGFSVCQLSITPSISPSLTNDFNDSFPVVTPRVIADMPFSSNNTIGNMFVSPYEFGVLGATTRQRQLIIWDATISAPSAKINLFKSTEKHLSYREMYNKWYGCLAMDTLDCGTFTDRRDGIIVGGSKLYMVDLRSRALGFLFPRVGVRPPSSYRFPKMNARLPVSDRFLAIERHPHYSTLYGIISSVSSSILLWDLRNPDSIISEIPLPLIRHGRGRFRSLAWHPIPTELTPNHEQHLNYLSAFCWDYNAVTVSAMSIYNSSSVIESIEYRQSRLLNEINIPQQTNPLLTQPISPTTTLGSQYLSPNDDYFLSNHIHETMLNQGNNDQINLNQITDKLMNKNISQDLLLNQSIELYSKNKHITEQSIRTEFWNIYDHNMASGSSPFFVNPFKLFPSPLNSALPVCEPTGLCFSSLRPPYQVVIYHQIQLPLGIPSTDSERRYFSPYGPVLSNSHVLINEGQRAPLAEGPLSQLFHGLAGVQLITLKIPIKQTNGYYLEPRTLAFGLTFSGRLQCVVLELHMQPRKRMLLSSNTAIKHKPSQMISTLFSDIIDNFHFNTSEKMYNIGPVPSFTLMTELLKQNTHNRLPISSAIKGKTISWMPFTTQTFNDIQSVASKSIDSASFFFLDNIDTLIQARHTRGLHELLQCNTDSLEYHSFIMSQKTNFTRQRIETIPFWKHPDLNAIYFAEALLNLIVGSPSLQIHQQDSVRSDANCSVLLTDPSVLCSSKTDTIQKTPIRSMSCPDDVLKIFQLTKPSEDCEETHFEALTLSEVFTGCTNPTLFEKGLQLLSTAVKNGQLQYWIASTAGLDREDVDILPFHYINNRSHSNIIWRGIADRIVMPLCSCGSLVEHQPLILYPDTETNKCKWQTWGPTGDPLVFQSMVRFLIDFLNKETLYPFLKNHSMKKNVLQDNCSSTQIIHSTLLNRLSKSLLSNFCALPIPQTYSDDYNQKILQPSPLQCNLFPFENKFCLLNTLQIFKRSSIFQEDDDFEIIQGRHFINVDNTSLNEASHIEKRFILNNAPRDYPASYSFLTGVRVTVNLYENLKNTWNPNRTSVTSCPVYPPTTKIFYPTSNNIPLNNSLLSKNPNSGCPISSIYTLPMAACIATHEKLLLEESQKQLETVDAIASQLEKGRQTAFLTRQSIQDSNNESQSSLLRHLLKSASQTIDHTFTENQMVLPLGTPTNNESAPPLTELRRLPGIFGLDLPFPS